MRCPGMGDVIHKGRIAETVALMLVENDDARRPDAVKTQAVGRSCCRPPCRPGQSDPAVRIQALEQKDLGQVLDDRMSPEKVSPPSL